MARYLVCLFVAFYLLTGCGTKKKPSLSGTDEVAIGDFIESFELITPPYEVNDTVLNRKEKDSLLIANKIFSQFVPDSVLVKVFGKNAKPKIYLGKRIDEKEESYLFAKTIAADKKAILVLCFDEKNNFSFSYCLFSLCLQKFATSSCIKKQQAYGCTESRCCLSFF